MGFIMKLNKSCKINNQKNRITTCEKSKNNNVKRTTPRWASTYLECMNITMCEKATHKKNRA